MYPERQLAYAPTPYSYTPSSALTATINLDEVCIFNPRNLNQKLTSEPGSQISKQ